MCTLQVGKKTRCLFLPVFLLMRCTSVIATSLVSEQLLLSMPPQHAATRPLARAYTRACNNPVTSVDAPSGQARRTCQLTGVSFGAALSRCVIRLPTFLSHCHSVGLHFDCNYAKPRAVTAAVGFASTSPASRYTQGSVSGVLQGSHSSANINTTSTSTSLVFPLQKPRSTSATATSASGTRVPWGRLPCLVGFTPVPQSTSTFRTRQKYAFSTGERQLLCSGSRCYASANSKDVATMEIPETPVVLSGEPLYIPIVGCKPAENVAIGITPCKNAATFSGDLIIFGLLSCKPSPGAISGGGKEEKKCKKELACFSLEIRELDKKLTHGILYEAAQHEDFEAKLGTHMGVRVPGSEGTGKKILHAVALGLGAATELKPAAAAKAGAAVAALLQRPGYSKAKELGLIWPRVTPSAPHGAAEACGAAAANTPATGAAADAMQRRLLQSFIESFLVEMQPDTRFKGESGCDKEKKSHLEKIMIYAEEMDESYQKNIEAARILAKSVYFAQELVNAPANFCNPVTLAQAAVQMAKKVGITAEVLQQKELEKMGMFSYLSVNKGSLYPPQFIHLTYKPRGGQSVKRLVFVGKGVCFDSGGYNIKSAASMIELMKFDMAGGAAVLGALFALGHLQPPHVEVHAVVAACENMVSEKAYRPGDVITAADGKTIEVGNTDAEGRLTLADALVYAEKHLHPHVVVDVATLTGAVVIALGHRYAALYSTCDTLADHLLHSAESSGELMWRMPLVKEYTEALESKIADLQNVGGKNKAGSILGAVFLEQFIQNTPWAHLDIAGTAWDAKRSRATGYGVRTLVEYALEISRQQGAGPGN